MNVKNKLEFISLTRSILDNFWQKKMDMLIENMHDDVTMIFAQKEQYIIGIEGVKEELAKIERDIKTCHLRRAAFDCKKANTGVYIVTGRYLVETDDVYELYLAADQRCSFVWVKGNNCYKIKHLHVSNPIGELRVTEGESFVNTIGEIAHQYIEKRIFNKTSKSTIDITDYSGTVIFMNAEDIVYLESDKRHTIIHTKTGDKINAIISFAEIEKMLTSNFFRVHRCYIINTDYVSEIKTNKIIMYDNAEIPIPQRKYADIKRIIVENKTKL